MVRSSLLGPRAAVKKERRRCRPWTRAAWQAASITAIRFVSEKNRTDYVL